MWRGRARLVTCHERGAELDGLRAERERRADPSAIHDAARGDHRAPGALHDLRHQRERPDERVLEPAEERAAMAAGLGALRADRIDAELIEHAGFVDRG